MSETTEHTTSSECDALLDYVYGELTGEALERFKLHLLGCEKCKRELAGLERVRSAVKQALPPAEPPAEKMAAMHAQLMHAAAQRKPKRGKVLMFARRVASHPVYAAAAMFAIVATTLTLNWSHGKLAMPAADQAPLHEQVSETAKAAPVVVGGAAPAEAPKPKQEFAQDKPAEPQLALRTDSQTYTVKSPAKKHSAAPTGGEDDARLLVGNFGDAEGQAGKKGKLDSSLDGLNTRDEGGLDRRAHASSGAGLGSGSVAKDQKTLGPARTVLPKPAAEPPPPPAKVADVKEREKSVAQGRGYQAPSTPEYQNQAPAAAAPTTSAPMPVNQVAKNEPPPAQPTETPALEAAAEKPAAPVRDTTQLRKQAESLANSNRCEEALALYQQLEKQNPKLLSAKEKANYARCLSTRRLADQNAAADEENKANAPRASKKSKAKAASKQAPADAVMKPGL